jgi:hypothetical protein
LALVISVTVPVGVPPVPVTVTLTLRLWLVLMEVTPLRLIAAVVEVTVVDAGQLLTTLAMFNEPKPVAWS